MNDDNERFVSITDEHGVRRDSCGWTLRTWWNVVAARNTKQLKKGDVTRRFRDRYFGPNLEQPCRMAIDECAGNADDAKGIMEAIEKAHLAIASALSGMTENATPPHSDRGD